MGVAISDLCPICQNKVQNTMDLFQIGCPYTLNEILKLISEFRTKLIREHELWYSEKDKILRVTLHPLKEVDICNSSACHAFYFSCQTQNLNSEKKYILNHAKYSARCPKCQKVDVEYKEEWGEWR